MTRRTVPPVDARRSRDPGPKAGCSGLCVFIPSHHPLTHCLHAARRSGAHPARERLRRGITRDPRETDADGASWHLDADSAARGPDGDRPGTFSGIDQESAVILTAEASLPMTSGTFRGIRTPVSRNVATHIAENQTD